MSETIRVIKNKDFTIMSNYHLRDKSLSLKAKGLLSQMLSLPENWDYTIAGLAAINKDGIDSIKSAIKELEKAGYIQRERIRNEKGQVKGIDYIIYETPPKPKAENPLQVEPKTENPTQEKPIMEKHTQLNTNKLNTNINNQSIYQSKYQSKDKKIDRQIDDNRTISQQYEQYKLIFKENISYDAFVQDDVSLVDEIVNIAAEVLAFQQNPVKINSNLLPADIVKKRLLELKKDDIDYILLAFSRNTKKIHNIKSYILTSLYNAPTTKNHFLSAAVKSDFIESGSL